MAGLKPYLARLRRPQRDSFEQNRFMRKNSPAMMAGLWVEQCYIGAENYPLFFIGYPCGAAIIVLESGGILQTIFGRIHHEIPLAVILCRGAHSVKWYCNILFAGAEETSYGDDQRRNSSRFVHQHILDFPDFGVLRVVNALFVPVGYGN
jgi:hypothetical protein